MDDPRGGRGGTANFRARDGKYAPRAAAVKHGAKVARELAVNVEIADARREVVEATAAAEAVVAEAVVAEAVVVAAADAAASDAEVAHVASHVL